MQDNRAREQTSRFTHDLKDLRNNVMWPSGRKSEYSPSKFKDRQDQTRYCRNRFIGGKTIEKAGE